VENQISDEELRRLVIIAKKLEDEYGPKNSNDPWVGSPFAWIRTRPSRQVGKIGEELVACWCKQIGLEVRKPKEKKAEADLVIEGRRVEVKFSTLWEANVYKFQQLRDQEYDYVICLGVSPFDAHCWIIPKNKALRKATGQHTGSQAQDTRWLTIDPKSPPKWLKTYGGTLIEAKKILQNWRAHAAGE
jgi:hypothetical protein